MRLQALVALSLLFALAGPSGPLQAQTAPVTGTSDPAPVPIPDPPVPAVAPPPATVGSELTLLGKKDGQEESDFRFRLGDSIDIRATGTFAAAIRTELAKSASTRVLVLHIDDVPMAELPIDATTGATGAADADIQLHVQLARNPNEDDNRDAWNALLKKQSGYTMEPELALAIGSAPAVDVRSAQTFRLYVAPRAAIGGTLAAGLLLFLVLFYLLVRNRSALRNTKDGPYSLGKSQMAFWGLLVLLTFVGVWLLTDTMERIPSQVLILLGISGATGLGALMIGADKPGEVPANVARAVATPSKPRDFFRDICSDGDGLSLHRLQVAAWTLVLGAVFIRAVSQAISMPEFSETLLVLMGISNGTYLGFKFPEKP